MKLYRLKIYTIHNRFSPHLRYFFWRNSNQIRFMFDDFAMVIRALGQISIAVITGNVTKGFSLLFVFLSIHYDLRRNSKSIGFIFSNLTMVSQFNMVSLILLEKKKDFMILFWLIHSNPVPTPVHVTFSLYDYRWYDSLIRFGSAHRHTKSLKNGEKWYFRNR